MKSVLPLLLLLAGCAAQDIPEPPRDGDARRSFWRERVAGVFGCHGEEEVLAYLKRIRTPPPHRPESLGGGKFYVDGASTSDDLFTLDETFNLYLVWNSSFPGQGIRSAEVVGFADLRSRFRPEHFGALEALHRCPSARNGWSFDPILVLRAVNALQALGGEALPALRSYVELARGLPPGDARKYSLDEYRLFPVVQLLTTKPSPFLLGDGGVLNPGSATWPWFPLTVEKDLPFTVVTGYVLAGKPENILGRLGSGVSLRSQPLLPSADPIDAAESLLSSPAWEALLNAEARGNPKPDAQRAKGLRMLIRRQALEAIASAYRPSEDDRPPNCCADPDEGAWRRIVDEVRTLGVRWDPQRQDFVRSR